MAESELDVLVGEGTVAAPGGGAAARGEKVRTRGAGRPVRTLLRDLVVLGVMALGIEGVLRVGAPEYGRQHFDQEFTGSYPLQINADGYRGAAVPRAKEKGEFRVLGLGDSITFGTSLPAEAAWPVRLGGFLQGAVRERKVSAMNASMPSTSLNELRYAYEQKWAEYQPDVVTVLVTGNMVSLSWIRRQDAPRMPENGFLQAQSQAGAGWGRWRRDALRQVHTLCLPSFLSINSQRAFFWLGLANHDSDPEAPYGSLLAHGYRQGNMPAGRAGEAWGYFAADLAKLKESCARRKTPLIVGYAPLRFMLTDSVWDNEKLVERKRVTIDPAARLAELCKAQGIRYVDLTETLRQERLAAAQEGQNDPLYVLFDYAHLDARGHKAAAEALAREILPALGGRGW